MSGVERSCVAALLLVAAPEVCAAVVIQVPQDYPTIGEAAAVASLGDTVLVASGTYYEHDILLSSGVCLMGETGDPDDVIIHAEWQGQVVRIVDTGATGETRLLGFTVRRGSGILGGGLYAGGAVRVQDVIFDANLAQQGGAIACEANAVLELENCAFVCNYGTCDKGGAVFGEGLRLTATGCVFDRNRAGEFDGRGGALYLWGSLTHCVLEDCAFLWNETLPGLPSGDTWGGAIYMESGELTVRGCTFFENIAVHGAAIWADSGSYENTIFWLPSNGPSLSWGDSPPMLECCDLDGWYGEIAEQLGVNGNICEDPLLCLFPTDPPWALAEESPCAPANSGGCGLIGAADVGCDLSSPIEPLSWGSIKSLYW